jgi:hypothetical protein
MFDARLLMLEVALMLMVGVQGALAQVALLRDGALAAALRLPAQPDADEKLAAQELQAHLKLMAGVELPVGGAADTVITLGGEALDDATRREIQKISGDPFAFALIVEPGRIRVAGLTGKGTLCGVYELLEQLGVRWFFPGELGLVVPARRDASLAPQRTIQGPSFQGRWEHPCDPTWQRRQRMGGVFFNGAHGIPPFNGSAKQRRELLEKEPECFALNATTGQRQISQICVANPRTLALVVEEVRKHFRGKPAATAIGMGPNDSRGFCECDACRALDSGDWDPYAHEPSHTDRYIWFYNQVLKAIEAEFPDKQIHTYLYHSYIRPPVKVTPDRRIFGGLAPISLCRLHGPGNPVCKEKDYLRELTSAWGQKLEGLYDRGYWFNLADPGFPFQMVSRVRREIPLAHEWGVDGWRVETLTHWASETPSLYIAAKLMWNHRADVNSLLKDFHEKFYESAAAPMAGYQQLLDTAIDTADHHTGSSFDLPLIYDATLRAKARALLDEAARLAPPGLPQRRVALARESFDYVCGFIEMIEARNRHDYAAAAAALQRVDELQTHLIKGYDVPMIHPRTSPSYLKRFFRMPVEQGHERTSGGNRFIAGLGDRWEFQTDPDATGLARQLIEPGGGEGWKPLLTASSSWSNQGLRYYKGQAWYRQTVAIPAGVKGQRVFLWFGGVDEKAEVYLNGQRLGISSGSAFVPFELDATAALRPGQDNLVVVRVLNDRLDELGTGGITAPAMFYAPAEGDGAQPRNVQGLSETFP